MRTERLDDRIQEFPRINDAFTGSRHRFGYTVAIGGGRIWDDDPKELSTALLEHDFNTAGTTVAPLDTELVIGEMAFVARPHAASEDDGVLMGYGHHRGRDEGQLILLDAQTLETAAVVHLPQRVPMGFHGNWCPA